MKRVKYMVQEVTVANGTAADTTTLDNFNPDQDYKFITGVDIQISGATGDIEGGAHVNIGLRDAKGDIHELCHMNNWISGTNVPPDMRFKSLRIPIDGTLIKCLVQNPVLSTAEYKIQFIFRLEDDLVRMANVN